MSNSAELLIRHLKRAINSKRFTKKTLCEAAGLGRAQLDRYLDGVNVPGIDTADRIADALDKPLHVLLDPGEPMVTEAKYLRDTEALSADLIVLQKDLRIEHELVRAQRAKLEGLERIPADVIQALSKLRTPYQWAAVLDTIDEVLRDDLGDENAPEGEEGAG